MKIIIKGEPQEVAAFVLEMQGRCVECEEIPWADSPEENPKPQNGGDLLRNGCDITFGKQHINISTEP